MNDVAVHSRSPSPNGADKTERARSKSPEKPLAREPDAEEEKPAKYFCSLILRRADTRRVRTARREDQARGKRMFGNILGTLRKFQDEDKNSKKSEAVSRPWATAVEEGRWCAGRLLAGSVA